MLQQECLSNLAKSINYETTFVELSLVMETRHDDGPLCNFVVLTCGLKVKVFFFFFFFCIDIFFVVVKLVISTFSFHPM